MSFAADRERPLTAEGNASGIASTTGGFFFVFLLTSAFLFCLHCCFICLCCSRLHLSATLDFLICRSVAFRYHVCFLFFECRFDMFSVWCGWLGNVGSSVDLTLERPTTAAIRGGTGDARKLEAGANPPSSQPASSNSSTSTKGLCTVVGREVTIYVGTTWGDPHFVGLTSLQLITVLATHCQVCSCLLRFMPMYKHTHKHTLAHTCTRLLCFRMISVSSL